MNITDFNRLKAKTDVSQVFLVVMSLVGDLDRAAAALDMDPAFVRMLSEQEGWAEKLKRVSVMSKSGKPGDFERASNRALCFVQSQCIRAQINRLLHEVTGMTDEELLSRACVRSRDGGTQLSAKFLVDLANAAEACHRMSYAALSDTVSERAERDGSGGPGGQSSNDLHVAIIAALSNPNASPQTVTQQLIAEANEQVQTLASAKAQPEPSVEAHPAE